MDRTSVIFGNKMPESVIRKAEKSKRDFVKKFGDDSGVDYHFTAKENSVIGKSLGVQELCLSDKDELSLPENAVIIGNIRMGFGHYRISMAMASAAKKLGYVPYWLDLCSLKGTTCAKIIEHQNELYSLGSRISQKSRVFNKVVWEPVNYDMFKQLSYNAADQKNAELMANAIKSLPKDVPFIATHVWPAQAAVHAGFTNVVNAIPDNWPMALHYAEGSIHTVQTPSAYLGYKALREMAKRRLKPMPDGTLFDVGHYVDDELTANIESDNAARIKRIKDGKPRRYLLTVGGAGAQVDIFAHIISRLLPKIKKNKAALFINVGDHKNVWEQLKQKLPKLADSTEHFNDFDETERFCADAIEGEVTGVHAFCNDDIFAAVYSTNLLMRATDVLITKPSELSFYPVPKLMIKRVGGHERWGAIRAAEVGDGTYECDTLPQIYTMLDLLQSCDEALLNMIENISKNNKAGLYNGAYKVVELATGKFTK
ncbi:MAG: hypothetical protein IJ172_05785 [Ruminococcus sp.]|nr:hypothetical protein [Ruminococcus sp.]